VRLTGRFRKRLGGRMGAWGRLGAGAGGRLELLAGGEGEGAGRVREGEGR